MSDDRPRVIPENPNERPICPHCHETLPRGKEYLKSKTPLGPENFESAAEYIKYMENDLKKRSYCWTSVGVPYIGPNGERMVVVP